MSKSPHKFQERMQSGMTYEQYFRDRCHEMVCLAEESERILGRKKTLEVMGKARDRYIAEITKKEREPVRNFDDFKADEKTFPKYNYKRGDKNDRFLGGNIHCKTR